MKIKYNLEYNYLNIYDEVQGIVANKQAIYRNEYRQVNSYTKEGFKFVKIAIIELIFLILFNILPLPSIFPNILTFIFSITVGGLVAYYIIFYSLYSIDRNRSHKGEITIDKDGVLDTTEDNVKIGIPWHYIECVIITDKVILFMSKVVASIVLTVDHYDEVMEAIERYQNDVKVLDKRWNRNILKASAELKKEVEELEAEKEEVVAEKVEPEKEEVEASPKPGRKKKSETLDQKIEDVEKAIQELTEE